MDFEHFEKYRLAENEGRKADAKRAILAFIASFQSLEEKSAFVDDWLHALPTNVATRIRHELFVDVVFPVLKSRHEQNDVQATIALARMEQNLHALREPWPNTEYAPGIELRRQAYEKHPHHQDIRSGYGTALFQCLDHVFHEWPSGLLIDHSNWRQELEEVKSAIALVGDLVGEVYQQTLAEFLGIIVVYRDRLSAEQNS